MTNLKMSVPDSYIAAIKSMSKNERSNLATMINSTDPFAIFNINYYNSQEIICPNCGNGSGSSHTGVKPNFENGVWLYHCFKCNEFSGDLLKIIATANNLDIKKNFFEVLAIGAVITNQSLHTFSYDNKFPVNNPTAKTALEDKTTVTDVRSQEKTKMIISDIEKSQANIDNIPIAESRCLKIRTLKKFHCGYLKNWQTVESRLDGIISTPTPRLIIPTGNHYLARLTVPIENFKDNPDFKHIKEKQHIGSKEPFGIEFITAKTTTIIIVEGEIDAMSIDQACNVDQTCNVDQAMSIDQACNVDQAMSIDQACNVDQTRNVDQACNDNSIAVIATLGAAVANNIKDKIFGTLDDIFHNANKEKKPYILILFDNDAAGRINSKKFCEDFMEHGYSAVADFLSGEDEKIDANCILSTQGEKILSEIIDSKIILAKKNLDEIAYSMEKEVALKNKITDWQNRNGTISPEALNELKLSVSYLQSLTVDKITSTVANESKTLRAIALCQFYDFQRQVADEVIARISAAKKIAKFQIKMETPDNPVSDSVRSTAEIVIKNVKESANKFFTQINRSHKEFLKQQERQKRQENLAVTQKQTTQTVIANCPIDLKIPNGFYFQKTGLYFYNNSEMILVSYTPLVVVRRLQVASTDSFKYEIAYYDYKGDWHRKIVDAGTLFDTKKILSLADIGVSITSNGAKFMCNYFNSLIYAPENAAMISTLRLFQHGGWTDDNCNEFIYPADGTDYVVHGFNFDYKNAFSVRGDKIKWREMFEKMIQFSPAIKLTLGAALAAPLIRMLKIRNEWLHLTFRSGVGKTAILKLAASIYGNPALLISKFNSTSNAMETQSIIFNDLPSFVDELQSLKKIDRENADNLVYNFESGTVRRRNTKENSLRPLQFFKGVKITTGEQGIIAETAGEGAISRCLELNSFNAIDNDTAIEIHRFSGENFGLFGRDWIKYVINHKQNITDTFKFYENSLIKAYKENFPNHCSIVALAVTTIEHFATAIGSTIFVNHENFGDGFKNMIEYLPKKKNSTNAARAIDAVADFIFAHPNAFPAIDENGYCPIRDIDNPKTPNEIYGFTLKNGDVAIFPRYLREKILNVFPSCAACIREFSENHFLDETNSSSQHPHQISIRVNNESPRYVYVFKKFSITASEE